MNTNEEHPQNIKCLEKKYDNIIKVLVALIVLIIIGLGIIYCKQFYKAKNIDFKKQYIIDFVKNNAISIDDELLSCTTTSTSCNITMPNISVNDRYEVIGWSEQPDATVATYQVGKEYTISKNMTLYAVIKEKIVTKTYTVVFNKNKSLSIASDSLSCSTTSTSCNITMPNISVNDRYEVIGWSEQPDATVATYQVGKEYTISKNMTLYAIVTESANDIFLSGDNLNVFKIDNNINQSSDIVVERTSKIILGVTFWVYYVYDVTEYNDNALSNFKVFAEHCFNNLAKVDYKILKKVASYGTSFVFFGSHTCDAALIDANKYTYAAYCNSINRNVVIGYEANRFNREYYENSIVHEFGHAVDFTLRYSIVGDTQRGISELNQSNIKNGFYNRNNVFINSDQVIDFFIKDEIGNPYSWDELSLKDASKLKQGMQDFTYYNVSDLTSRPHEFFAEVFSTYYNSSTRRNRMKSIAPLTYDALENIINYIK